MLADGALPIEIPLVGALAAGDVLGIGASSVIAI